MKSPCKEYDKETISKFVDKELSPEKNDEIKKHIQECDGCRNIFNHYTQFSELFEQNTVRQVDEIDTKMLRQNVLEQIKRKEVHFLKKVFDYFSPKFYLKIASVLVIMVAGLVYFQAQPINFIDTAGASAIVNSVDGDVSSVMIFETEKSKQTIIWFSEA